MDAIERLLADVEGEMAALALDEVRAEAAEMRRAEEATVILARRIMAARGSRLCLVTAGEVGLWLEVADCSEQWILGRTEAGEVLVPMAAIVAVRGLAPVGVGEFSGIVASKLSVAAALRAFTDRHRRLDVIAGGRRYSGLVARVGKDFVDVAGEAGTVCIALRAVERVEARGI